VIGEAMVQVLVALLNVGLAPVFLPGLNEKVLQEAVLEALAGRDDLIVVPVVQPVAHLEFLREFAKVSFRVGLEVGLLQLLAGFLELIES